MVEKQIDLSVIISLSGKGYHDNISNLYFEYKKKIEETGLSFEFIYVTDAESTGVANELNQLLDKNERIKIVKLAKWFGEAAALNAGFEQAEGTSILTLPEYKQIESDEIPAVIKAFDDQDMIIASRSRTKDKFLHRFQARVFHYLIKLTLGMKFTDLGCKVRIFKREILEEIYLYGDQFRFLPLIASRYGFKVEQRQASSYFTDSAKKVYSFGHYTERIVDYISIFFLIKFTKKPLRFFGFPGFVIFIIGALLALYLFIARVFFEVSLADRPIVLVSTLLIVFGIQLFAIGLVAEIIIFTHSKETKDYIVEEIINGRENDSQPQSKIKIDEKIKV
jgi:glycosyltransferase involved in cell wall biosynthesis